MERQIFLFPKYGQSNRASRLKTSETEAAVILSMVKVHESGESLSSCAMRHKGATKYPACVQSVAVHVRITQIRQRIKRVFFADQVLTSRGTLYRNGVTK